MKENTCCFTGHRVIRSEDKEELQTNLCKVVADLIDKGVTDFVCGGALGFDTLAAKSVLMYKKYNSGVRLILALPCPEQPEKWSNSDKRTYEDIKAASDEVFIVSPKYTSECMMQRNRFMVDMSFYCVAYFRNIGGGTLKTIQYAKEKELTIKYL
ncbi:MAG: DUF1273 family protein [Clostridia bacterium]|nr:DUF1273 family protein [Clostridia bacterium]